MKFTFKPEFDSVESIPEDFRGLYAVDEESGAARLRDDDPGVKSAVAAITGLNAALTSERAALKSARKGQIDLSPLAEFGESPDEIRAAIESQIEELQGQVEGGKEARLNIDKIKQDLAQAHAKDLKSRDARVEALQGQLHQLLVTNSALSALGDAIDPELVMPFISSRVKAVEEEGQYQVFVVDDAGDRRYSGTTGQPMTIGELVKEMKSTDKFKPLFKSEANDGSGHRPSTARNPSRQGDRSTMSAIDKINAGLQANNR